MNIDVSSGYDAQTISGEAWRLQVSVIRNQQVVRSIRIAGSIFPFQLTSHPQLRLTFNRFVGPLWVQQLAASHADPAIAPRAGGSNSRDGGVTLDLTDGAYSGPS